MTIPQVIKTGNPAWDAKRAEMAVAPLKLVDTAQATPGAPTPAQQQLSEASAAVIRLLKLLDPNGWHNLVRIHPETGEVVGKTFAPGSWAEIAQWVDTYNGTFNLYFSPNEPKPNSPDKKLKKQDIAFIRALVIDVDPEEGVAFDRARMDLDAEAKRAQTLALAPSITLDTGGGNQYFWLLEEKVDALNGGQERAEAQGEALQNIHGGDDVHSIEHIFRLPGTLNLPNTKKRAAGRSARPAKLLFQNDRRYTLEAFEQALVQVTGGNKSNTDPDPFIQAAFIDIDLDSARAVGNFDDLDGDLKDRFNKARAGSKRLAGLWDGDSLYLKGDKSRSGWRMCLAHELCRSAIVTFSAQDYVELVHAWPVVNNSHDLDLRQYAKDWGKASAAADAAAQERASHFEKVTDGSSDEAPRKRPLITIRDGELAAIATEAETALIAAGAPFYKRGGAIVRPIVDSVPAADNRKTTILRTVQASKESITDHLARVADWQKFDGRSKKMVPADPSRSVAEIILSRDGEWRFKELAGVIGTPTLRPDLSLLSVPGHDEATALWLGEPPEMPDVPLKPTRAQAEEALALLIGLLRDFSFETEADRSVALSILMTPIVRGAMPCAPLHAVRAPTPGTGKSYLVDLAAALSTGQPCPVISPHPEEKELEKRLGAALLDGQSLVSIDNLNGALSGDALCQMVDRPLVQVRPLGVSKLVRIENKHTIFATGNNLHLVGDIVRRTIVCTLDTGMERPETRKFSSNAVAAVLADQGRYVAAVLTIVLAYKEADFPNQRQDFASFDQWSKIVRSPLIWLGCADPVATTETARAEDPILSTLSAVMIAWRDSVGLDKPLSAGDLKACADLPAYPELHAALLSVAGDRSTIDTRRLGQWLGKYKGRIVGGLKFEAQEDNHAKQKVWVLKSAGKAGICGYVSNLTWETVSLDTANTSENDTSLEGVEKLPADTRLTRKDILSEPIGAFA
jgi:putative DNA primase/helicase